jgi:hypothetical protein
VTTSPVMHLLESGVPLTLLIDLLAPSGPDSVGINSVERPPGDPIWLDAADHRGWQQFILHAG